MVLTITMIISSTISLLALVAGGNASVLARRVEQSLENRRAYQGGWMLTTPGSCPQNYTVDCSSDKTSVTRVCCPDGNTCFGSSLGYCCPTAQDCRTYVDTFPVCSDPTANMYPQLNSYFCCAQGLTGVIPNTGWGFCESADVSVAVSLLATMASQYGGTSVTPFGGYATAAGTATGTGNAVTTGPGGVTQTAAGANPTKTGSSAASAPTPSSLSSSGFSFSTGTYIGLGFAAVVVIVIITSIWRCCRRRSSDFRYSGSSSAGPSMMPAYINPGTVMYAPTPAPPYMNDVYDPILERHTAVSPMSPPFRATPSPRPMSPSPRLTPSPRPSSPDLPLPMSPSPAYTERDEHELAEGRGMYDPVEVHGFGSLTGRAELG